jgi:hypothetical protein
MSFLNAVDAKLYSNEINKQTKDDEIVKSCIKDSILKGYTFTIIYGTISNDIRSELIEKGYRISDSSISTSHLITISWS